MDAPVGTPVVKECMDTMKILLWQYGIFKKIYLHASMKVPFILVMSQIWLLLGSLVIYFSKVSWC